MSLVIVLTACGNKYEDDINQVLDMEKKESESMKNVGSDWITLDKNKTNNYVYEDGKVILIEYVSNKSNLITRAMYVKNATSGKFEAVNEKEKEYMKTHEPVYKEMNLKKK
ncbi:cystatin-like fold lipoprotein [Macrococcus capreoli]